MLILPLSFPFMGQLPGVTGAGLSIDWLRVRLLLLTAWLIILISAASYEGARRSLISFVFWGLFITLVFRFTAKRVLMFYFYFESSLVPTFMLVLGWGYQPERLRARLRLLFYTLFASLPLLLLIIFLIKNTYLYRFSGVFFLSENTVSKNAYLIFILTFAFLVKFPIYFVHLWLPKAHVEAPVSGSIILAGVLLKLGGYGVLRLRVLYTQSIIPLVYCMVAMWGAAALRVRCLRIRDIKVLIAYSSVVHMALVIVGAMGISSWGLEGRIIIMVAHGVCSSGIFAQANAIYERRHSRSLMLNKGYLRVSQRIGALWFILVVGNFGGPFTLNLIGEIFLIIRAIGLSNIFWISVRFLRFFSAAYSLVLYRSTQQGVLTSSVLGVTFLSFREILLIFRHVWVFLFLILSPSMI